MFKGHDPAHGEYVNNPAYWCNGSRNLNELIDCEFRHAENALEPPEWSQDDIFWATANGKPYFRKGRRSPMYNQSSGVAKLVHPGFSYNFPGPNTNVEELPQYRTTRPIRCSTFDGREKPLVTKLPNFDDDSASAVASTVSSQRWRGSRKDRGLAGSSSAPSLSNPSEYADSEYAESEFTTSSFRSGSVRSFGAGSMGSVARSKLAVRPYHFGAIPGGRWPQHGGRIINKYVPTN
jgi:hypothetical protein